MTTLGSAADSCEDAGRGKLTEQQLEESIARLRACVRESCRVALRSATPTPWVQWMKEQARP